MIFFCSLLKLRHLTKPPVLPSVSRGDVFDVPQEEGTSPSPSLSTTFMPTSDTAAPTLPSSFPSNVPQAPTPPADPDAAACSGQAFDAFLQLKNGSIYAFRGKPQHLKGFLSYGMSLIRSVVVTLLSLCSDTDFIADPEPVPSDR